MSECVAKARFWHTHNLTDCCFSLIVVMSQGLQYMNFAVTQALLLLGHPSEESAPVLPTLGKAHFWRKKRQQKRVQKVPWVEQLVPRTAMQLALQGPHLLVGRHTVRCGPALRMILDQW